ncbi:hypothetical protein HYALB_00012120 [Hymenoscyphus albidus]|uniref:Uncharacterized protein n=1 Tax=Hymenoscyphus albidus TaxID=595503 RepID=A0A9N9QA51_9HELO|nr:hypothetical protein HYALB_00012120 [Hymenoscyphus albidus]
MSSSTALLPKDRKNNDHPIFLRVCHSPWVSIDQKSLLALRFVTAVYLSFSFVMVQDFEHNQQKRGWLSVFDFGNIAYFLQVLYHWMAFSWTFMHLHYPHHGSQERSASTLMQKFFSPPRQRNNSTCGNNRVWFSVFYYAVHSFPHVVTLIQWSVLYPRNHTQVPADEVFGHGWLVKFFVFNKFAVNSAIALIEVFFFSSIKRADSVWAHIFGITFLSSAYVGWSYTGYAATGKFAYYFFDHNKVGWDDASAAVMAFIASANSAFVFVYGLTSFREKLTTQSEQKSYGYTSLPQ